MSWGEWTGPHVFLTNSFLFLTSTGATLPVTRPSLAAVSSLYCLNSKQAVAFYTAASVLLRAFLACDDSLHGDAERATAFSHIDRHLASHGGGQILMYLGGEGGTGKSTCIRAIEHFSLAWGLRSTLALTAPTGSAAVVINGCTIHERRLAMKLTRWLDHALYIRATQTPEGNPHLFAYHS